MKENKLLIVDGFLFEDEATYHQAKKEFESIQYLKSRTNMDDIDLVLNLYQKTIEQKLFTTPVGLTYLQELRMQLKQIPYLSEEKIGMIPVLMPKENETENKIDRKNENRKEKKKREPESLPSKFRYSVAINLMLILVVIAMFFVTKSTNTVTILNYKTQLVNQYAGWKEELEEKETQLKQKEKELSLLEQQLLQNEKE